MTAGKVTIRSAGAAPSWVGAGTAAAAGVVLLLLPPTGTDLSGAVFRSWFALHHPLTPVSFSWYGGFAVGGYSALAPVVGGVLGVRLMGVLSAVAAAWFTGVVLGRTGALRPRLAAALAGLILVADVVSGRTTFALGVAFAMAAVAAVAAVPTGAGSPPAAPVPSRRRLLGIGALASLTALASPVAGLFLVLVSATLVLHHRRGAAAALLVGTALGGAVLVALGGGSGSIPFTRGVAGPTLLAVVGVAVAVRRRPLLLTGTVLYAAVVVLAYLVVSPVGSNVGRLGLLFAGTVLVGYASLRWVLLAPLLAATVWWQVHPAVQDVRHRPGSSATAGYYAGLDAALTRLGAGSAVVEVVPGRDHWETWFVGQRFLLARGWERQVDVVRAAPLYAPRLTADGYRSWLLDRGVAYVALPDGPLDWSEKQETAVLRTAPSWLVPVWSDAHWRLWRVSGATGLVDPPARVVSATTARVVMAVPAAGTVRLRLTPSHWLRVSGAGGRLLRKGTALYLVTDRAGSYTITAGL